ncbi:DUF262 domain-containing protein [Patescibacteria group bacterium]|nr:DUF262 domain-containing protein [Patescibacteria group bacterium]
MKATEIKLIDFLKKSPQFVIPIYQRTYSWNEKQCLHLWEDILRTGSNKNIAAHFIGSIVYVEKGLYSVAGQSQLLVIDGQQRLTTITLLIEALARTLRGSEPIEGFSEKVLRDYYLLDPREEGEKKYKLILSQTDKASLTALLDNSPEPKDYSVRIKKNFEFFIDKIDEEKNNLASICKGLAKLIIVDISLSRDQDNPQLIFESLNSTGLELSQADLIRNYILMGLEPELQFKLYNQYWRPMEIDFGQKGYASYFDRFMRHYLTVKTSVIPKEREVYEVFKQYAHSQKDAGVEVLVADIRVFAEYYCAMVLGTETDSELKMAFHDFLELKADVAFPFLLELYHDYDKKNLSAHELLKIVRLIESYVFRRAICSIPTNSMNKTFSTFSRNLKKDRYLESVQATFLLLPSYRRFPDNEEFKREIKLKNVYNFRSRSYWLRRLENYERKERVPVVEYTIEHIMPQNENLSAEWKSELGSEWERIQNTYLHTLGNLTLTGYNSEYSDRPFMEKRNMKGGFAESPLRLNKGVAEKEHWTEQEILNRAEVLSEQATKVWFAPTLERSILDAYKPKAEVTEYSIEDHPYLSTEPTRGLFEEFRKQVKALDPCVTETFLKQYVAYKMETNFVDVVPQAKRLRLLLNIAFSEINDPRGICRDVSAIGRWGNGDVDVGLSVIEDMAYVIGLVRQAFEKQMGNG